jgi:hypothetical protein
VGEAAKEFVSHCLRAPSAAILLEVDLHPNSGIAPSVGTRLAEHLRPPLERTKRSDPAPPGHWQVLRSDDVDKMEALDQLLDFLQELPLRERVMTAVLRLRRSQAPRGHGDAAVGNAMYKLGVIMRERGRYEEASAMLREARGVQQRVHGRESREVRWGACKGRAFLFKPDWPRGRSGGPSPQS